MKAKAQDSFCTEYLKKKVKMKYLSINKLGLSVITDLSAESVAFLLCGCHGSQFVNFLSGLNLAVRSVIQAKTWRMKVKCDLENKVDLSSSFIVSYFSVFLLISVFQVKPSFKKNWKKK